MLLFSNIKLRGLYNTIQVHGLVSKFCYAYLFFFGIPVKTKYSNKLKTLVEWACPKFTPEPHSRSFFCGLMLTVHWKFLKDVLCNSANTRLPTLLAFPGPRVFWKGKPQASLFNARGLGNAGKVRSRVTIWTYFRISFSKVLTSTWKYCQSTSTFPHAVSKYSLNNNFFCSGLMSFGIMVIL